jgi:SPP1 gp7 family putative phage head morphogenesis protein
MATPHVTGAAALYAATHPGASAEAIKDALRETLLAALKRPYAAGGVVGVEGLRTRMTVAADWDESQHPRDEQGQWTESDVSSSKEEARTFLEGQLNRFGGLARADAQSWAFSFSDIQKDRLVESFKPHLKELHTALEKKYGKTLTLYRAEHEKDVSSGIRSFSLSREGAEEFLGESHRPGKPSNVIREMTVPVEDVLAIGSTYSGEILVDTKRLRTAKEDQGRRIGPFRMRFDASTPQAIDWADRHAAELIDGISETSREAINNAVAEALEGGGLDELFEEILDAVGDEKRAELIARTETMRAASEGQREAWRQATDKGLLSGDEQRVWIATGDASVCPICEELDGATAPMGGEYPEPGGSGPPQHPRCRCTEGLS